jgi:hypothetical protein
LHNQRFPTIAKLALQLLCIPAISIPSERVVSTIGVVVNRLRTRLSPQHIDMIVYLRKNYHDYDSYDVDDDAFEDCE